MKYYKMPITDIRKMTSSDQALMIRAIVEKPSFGGNLYFETQADYEKWLHERQRNSKT